MADRGRVVVLGMMGRTPFAGVAWQVLHYLEGFRRAGFDVLYVEDTGAWPYDPTRNTVTDDARYAVAYIRRLMEWLGLGDRWTYVAPGGDVYGVRDALVGADALVNLTGATVLHDRHLDVPVRIYLETDPVAPQVEVARGRPFTIDLLAAHTHHFSFGENLGAPDCGVPVERFAYRATRQPVVCGWWSRDVRSDGRFTTVATWRQAGRDVEWQGETYFWSKDREFRKVLGIPARTSQRLELALACDDAADLAALRSHGWEVVDALAFSTSIFPYRDYVLRSRGEFTVAKDQNVRLRSGWFSDRSACYLAAGKPVVTQDTGFGRTLPTGEGLFAFRTAGEAVAALEAVAADYDRHARAAAEIAREFFAAETIVAALATEAGL